MSLKRLDDTFEHFHPFGFERIEPKRSPFVQHKALAVFPRAENQGSLAGHALRLDSFEDNHTLFLSKRRLNY